MKKIFIYCPLALLTLLSLVYPLFFLMAGIRALFSPGNPAQLLALAAGMLYVYLHLRFFCVVWAGVRYFLRSTPITDEVQFAVPFDGSFVVDSADARKLENALAEAKAKLAELRKERDRLDNPEADPEANLENGFNLWVNLAQRKRLPMDIKTMEDAFRTGYMVGRKGCNFLWEKEAEDAD